MTAGHHTKRASSVASKILRCTIWTEICVAELWLLSFSSTAEEKNTNKGNHNLFIFLDTHRNIAFCSRFSSEFCPVSDYQICLHGCPHVFADAACDVPLQRKNENLVGFFCSGNVDDLHRKRSPHVCNCSMCVCGVRLRFCRKCCWKQSVEVYNVTLDLDFSADKLNKNSFWRILKKSPHHPVVS